MDAPEELVALVDAEGQVVGSAPRSRVRRENLRHLSTAVLVRDPRGRIYVHRRSDAKDWRPGHHDAAAGGVLQVGEDPARSAERELAEELGILGAPLTPLLVAAYEDDDVRALAHCFEVTWDGPVEHADGEVAEGGWWTLTDLARRLADPAWPFMPDTRSLLERLAHDRVGDYGVLAGCER